jgi:hypothetical protein
MTTAQDTLTLDNFRELTGHKFRVTNSQQARIFLTRLPDYERIALGGANAQRVAEIAGKTTPSKWMELVGDFATKWNDDPSLPLTREQAFQEFLSGNGPDRIKNSKPDVPLSVYQDPNLTLENFSSKVEAAIGVKRRFRLPQDIAKRVANKEITREDGFQETIRRKKENNE